MCGRLQYSQEGLGVGRRSGPATRIMVFNTFLVKFILRIGADVCETRQVNRNNVDRVGIVRCGRGS